MKQILVCCRPRCVAGGSRELADNLRRCIAEKATAAEVICEVENIGCSGQRELDQIVCILPEDCTTTRSNQKMPKTSWKREISSDAGSSKTPKKNSPFT